MIGDASHMGPPNGLGVNLAMEDAVMLGHFLSLHGITPEALRRSALFLIAFSLF